MKCAKCNTEIAAEALHEHAGQPLCEDCYIDKLAAPRTCDPWAVYSAKNMGSETQLTADQRSMIDLVKAGGPMTQDRICRELGIDENQFRSDFATLRHLELMRACKSDAQIRYTLFNAADSLR